MLATTFPAVLHLKTHFRRILWPCCHFSSLLQQLYRQKYKNSFSKPFQECTPAIMLHLLFVFISCFFCSFSAAVSHHPPSSAQCDVMINSICGIHFDTTAKCIVFLSCIMSCTKSEYTTWQAEVNHQVNEQAGLTSEMW